jgi:rare lipoprotein A
MKLRVIFLILLSISLIACVSEPKDGPPNHYVDVSKISNAKPKVESKSKYGNPKSYVVFGKRYHVMQHSDNYHATGIASWYGTKFDGKLTSSREPYSMYKMTAAHKTLPLPTYAKVTNLQNNKEVIVKINDRGPFSKNRLIDLSYAAARKLGITAKGTGLVKIDVINLKQLASSTQHKKPFEIYLQIGAYGNKTSATDLAQHIQKIASLPCKVYPKKNHAHTLYHVQVGPIKTASLADKMSAKLKKAGFPKSMLVTSGF